MIPLRWYLYLAAVAVLAGILWRDHHLSRLLKTSRAQTAAESARADQAEVQIAAEKAARVHEQTIAKAASDEYEKVLAAVRAVPAIGPVRLCLGTPKMPRTDSATKPARQPDAPSTGRVEGENEENLGPDIGPEIDSYVNDCEANAAQLDSLQGWIMAR